MQLALGEGEAVTITQQAAGWYKGYVTAEPDRGEGIFPANYVALGTGEFDGDADAVSEDGLPRSSAVLGRSVSRRTKQRAIGSTVESALARADRCLGAWRTQLKQLLRSGDTEGYANVRANLSALQEWRRQLVIAEAAARSRGSDDTSQRAERAAATIRERMLRLVEASRQVREGLIVPRTDTDEIATEANTNVMELFRMHIRMQSRLEAGSRVPRGIHAQEALDVEAGVDALDSGAGGVLDAPSSAGSVSAPAAGGAGGGAAASSSTSVTNGRPKRRGSFIRDLDNIEATSEAQGELSTSRVQVLFEVRNTTQSMATGYKVQLYFSLWVRGRGSGMGGSAVSARKIDIVGDGGAGGTFVSEEFLVSLKETGEPEHVGMTGNLKTVFQNVPASDFESGQLHLVVYAYRVGALVVPGKKRSTQYRRPLGCGVVALPAALCRMADATPWTPAGVVLYRPVRADESRFFGLHEAVANATDIDSGLVSPVPETRPLQLVLRPFSVDHSELISDPRFSSLLDSGSRAGVCTKMTLFRNVRARDVFTVRNELYVTLLGGTFSQDKKRSARNIQVRMLALLPTGEPLPVLVRGTGPRNAPRIIYESSVYYHCNDPQWNETVCVNIPTGLWEFENTHLLFVFYHCSTSESKTQPFSFSFLPLADTRGIALEDGVHVLPTFKPAKWMASLPTTTTTVSNCEPSYLPIAAGFDTRPENFSVMTRLISNTKTNNEQLHALRNWRHVSRTVVVDALKHMTYIEDTEAATFLKDIIDALFDVMVHAAAGWRFDAPESGDSAQKDETALPDEGILSASFSLFITLLNQLTDRYRSFRPALDQYLGQLEDGATYQAFDISKQHVASGGDPAAAASHIPAQPRSIKPRQLFEVLSERLGGLLTRLTAAPVMDADDVPDPEELMAQANLFKDVTLTFKCLDYVVRFAVASFNAFRSRRSGGETGDDVTEEQATELTDAFEESMRELVLKLQELMTLSEPEVAVVAQAFALQKYTDVVEALTNVLHLGELAEITRVFLQSIPVSRASTNSFKLKMISELVGGPLFPQPSFKGALMETIVRLIILHVNRNDQERSMCINLMGTLIEFVQSARPVDEDDIWRLSIVLPDLVKAAVDIVAGISADAEVASVVAKYGNAAQLKQSMEARGILDEKEAEDLDKRAIVVILALVWQMTDTQMEYYMEAVLPDEDELRFFITNLLRFSNMLLSSRNSAFREEWLIMNMFMHATVAKVLQWCTSPLVGPFLLGGEKPAPPPPPHEPGTPLAAIGEEEDGTGSDGGDVGVAEAKQEDSDDGDDHSSDGDTTDSDDSAALEVPTDEQLWDGYFALALQLLNSPTLNGDGASAARMALIKEQYGDLRVDVCAYLRSAWSALGRSCLEFAPKLVSPCMELAHSDSSEVARLARDMYLDLLGMELKLAGNVTTMERLTIDAVDRLVQQHASTRADEDAAASGSRRKSSARQNPMFARRAVVPGDMADNIGTESFEPTRSDLMMVLFSDGELGDAAGDETEASASGLSTRALLEDPTIRTFLREIRHLYAMLRAVSHYPRTADFEDERTAAALELIAYLRRTHRHDMYTRYVNMLSELHSSLGNVAEAAKTHLLHASLLDWGTDFLPAVTAGHGSSALGGEGAAKVLFPAETAAARLERILIEAIDAFDAAACWEDSVSLCVQLREHYESKFRFTEIAQLLRREATLIDKMTTEERFFPAYFYVHFVGMGFPKELRDTHFVYRGDRVERLGDFQHRLQRKWPQMVQLRGEVSDEHRTKPGRRYFAISTVSPASEDEIANKPPVWEQTGLGRLVRAGLQNRQIGVFSYSKTFRKRAKKTGNEVLDTWAKRVYLVTADTFPCTHRRSTVVRTHTVEKNPVELSVAQLRESNVRLSQQADANEKVKDGQADQGFTMLLNGMVDAAVSGGVANFEALLTGEYERTHPEIHEDMQQHPYKSAALRELRAILREQLGIVRRALRVHGVKCAPEMRPLHEHLESRFKDMADMFVRFGVIDERAAADE